LPCFAFDTMTARIFFEVLAACHSLNNVEEDTEDIKQIARYISSITNSFNQVAHRVNKGGKLYDEDIADMKARLEEVL